MTMAMNAEKAAVAHRLAIIGLMIAVAVGAIAKQLTELFVPQLLVDVGKSALAGLLRGWNSSANTAADGCTWDENMLAVSTLGKLPPELRIKIFKLALTAAGGVLDMPCITDRPFRPNVAVGLLRVSRAMYHQHRSFLYTENVFRFDTFGSELPMINKPLGPTKCRLNRCGSAVSGPSIKRLHLDVGHQLLETQGSIMVEAMTSSLKSMKSKLQVEHLSLKLHEHSLDRFNFASFLGALQEVQVGKSLTIHGGADKYNNLNIFQIAIWMGMKGMPDKIVPSPRKDGCIDEGVFLLGFEALKDRRVAR